MLKRKMWRDIRKNISQFITIFLMVLIGIMAYSGIEAYMDGMKDTADKFYRENNLQDLNLIGSNFTKEDLEAVKNIKNVKNAERKLSVTALTDDEKTLLLNFIETNEISKFYVFEGERFDANKSGIWLDNFYAKENNLHVGDTILVKYDNLILHEEILGLINVPDHLYDVRDASELYPDRVNFGFAYMSINEIPESYIKSKIMVESNLTDETFELMFKDFNYKDYLIFNSIMVDVENNNLRSEVRDEIENKVESAIAIVDIEDTTSYVTYQGEIDEGKTYVGVFSGLFLFIAMLSVITTMTRVVKKERIEIGTLKSLGFKDSKVLIHYIEYSFWISLVASILGLILGYFLIGEIFIGMEMAFFEVPNGHPVMGTKNYLVAVLVVIVVSIITYFTCKSILKKNPAETLRNEIPKVKKKSLNLTTKGIFKKMSFSSIWNLRDIVRNKMRTFMGIAGVTGCCALIVASFGMLDSMNYFVKLQFEDLYNFDYKLTLKENITEDELDKLKTTYGDKTSKTFGIEIKDANGKKEANNIFVTDAKNYVRFVDNKGEFTEINSKDGVYITYKLASTKGYKLGDNITWHIYGYDKYYTTKIVGFNKDPQNQNITMTKEYLDSLGIEYHPDTLYTNSNLNGITEIEGVEVIQNIASLKEGMTNMLSTMKTMIVLIISIAILLGSIIIYNLGILSYTEKQYQFATLKVLGFKDNQIKKIFIKQNNWIAVISILIGLPSGFYLTDWLFKTAIEEHYDFGANITDITFLIAALGTFIVSYLVSKMLSRKVNNIDMVSSLKGNE